MERLTTNKEVSGMNMHELAHNSCYAKDGKARYRDFEDDFDEFMMDALQYGTDSILSLISVFYRNLWAMADLREALKEYEDLEEQGKLIELPCAVGGEVYGIINQTSNYDSTPYRIVTVSNFRLDMLNKIGKTVFLTRQEAEDKLAEMEGKNGN